MNKSKLLIAFSLLFICFNFAACEDEPIDPALLIVDENPSNDCAAPSAFQVSNLIGGTTTNLTWTAAAGTGAWQIQYGSQGFAVGSGTQINAATNNVTITSLNGTTSYEFYIRTVCNATEFSSWVGPVVLGGSIGNCPTPTGLTAVRSAGNTEVSVSWTTAATALSYQIQYGVGDFALGSGTTISASTSPKIITGLLANTAYNFYVRANCSATDNSSWAGPFNVAAVTGGGPIDASPALMTANIDGVQWNNLKPFLYPFSNDVIVENNGAPVGAPRFLWIQGTDNTTTVNLNNSREINLHIPNSKWAPGTYNLLWDNGYEAEECWATLLLFTNPDVNARIISGSLTVTEFNLSTKRIKGTFQFQYEKLDGNSQVIGVFPVTNGTFNYGLDADYFN